MHSSRTEYKKKLVTELSESYEALKKEIYRYPQLKDVMAIKLGRLEVAINDINTWVKSGHTQDKN